MRRKFIKDSSLTLAGLPFLKYLDAVPFSLPENSQIFIYATNWGFRGSVDEFCQKSKQAGYDGIEVWTPMTPEKVDELVKAVEVNGLKLGLLAGNWGNTFDAQLESYKQMINQALKLKPQFINSHSGKDFYSLDQNGQFLEYSFEASSREGIPIYHETHRGRMLYAAPIADKLMDRYNALRLTLDISHWCCVHESLLADQQEVVKRAIDRTDHIHARVGFPEGPQIPQPDDTTFAQAVKAHFDWWDEVVQLKVEKGTPLTMTTEFGPPPYMWTEPYSGNPLADNWEVNVQMKKLWMERYKSA